MTNEELIARALAGRARPTEYEDFLSARAILAVLDAAGLVIVPKEPTEAMLQAGENEMPTQGMTWYDNEGRHYLPFKPRDKDWVSAVGPYRAMIDAAQEKP